jgi:hypothetical protein
MPQDQTPFPPSSVVPPVMSPPVKKKVDPKLIVGGSVLAILLLSVPFGVYFLMNQNQDIREKATYDYVAPDPVQNEAPSSVNSESLNDSVLPAEALSEEGAGVAQPTAIDEVNAPAVLEGETTQ